MSLMPKYIGRALYSTTVNAQEVQKFSRLGKTWWNSNSASGTGPLHAMNPTRVDFIRNRLSEGTLRASRFPGKQLQGLRVLDVGCGGGLLAESLARLGATVTAIDPSMENITVASEHSKVDPLTASITYRKSTIEEQSKLCEKFDAVTALEVLEHIEMPLLFLSKCSACLDTGGSLFVSTLNRTAKSYALAILGAEYIAGILPPGTHEWNKFKTPAELGRILESGQVGLNVRSSKGMIMGFNQKYLSIGWQLSDSDLDVNYIVHAMKC